MGLHAVYGIEVAALRYFNVFGPRQDPSSQYSGVIPKFLTQSRDLTDVDDIVEGLVLAQGAPHGGAS